MWAVDLDIFVTCGWQTIPLLFIKIWILKTTQLLGQYLLQKKKMRLQGIGEFTLTNLQENPFEYEKGKIRIPRDSIQFSSDPKAEEDYGLINFISQKTGKLRSLASSDLEDYLNVGKQILNISKQFYIEGLGTLTLNDQNEFHFIQEHDAIVVVPTEEINPNKRITERKDRHTDISFENSLPVQKKRTETILRRLLVVFAVVIGITTTGWIVYYFFQHWQVEKSNKQNLLETIRPVIPAPSSGLLSDSISDNPTVPSSVSAPPGSGQSANYKVIIETAYRQRALTRYDSLKKWGHDVYLRTRDSVTFDLYTILNGPLSDTSRIRDSISRFFARRVWIELE